MGTAYNTNVVTDGLVACFDPANRKGYPGTGDKRSSPVNSIEATLYNSSDWDFVNEKGGFISFDGTNAYVSVGTSDPGYDAINLLGNTMSLCGWVNRLNDDDYVTIMSKRASGYMPQYEMTWYHSGGYAAPYAQIAFEIGTNGVMRSSEAALTGWHYVVATYDGTTVRFYIDGQPWGTASYTATLSDNGRPFKIANSGSAAGTAEADFGALYMYNRAITAAEIKQLYYMQKSRFED